MNNIEIQNTWNSPANNPPSAQQKLLADKFTQQMVRRRRFQGIMVTNSLVMLTLFVVLGAWSVVTGKAHMQHEWGLLPLLIVPWGFSIYFFKQRLQSGSVTGVGEESIIDSMKKALAANLSNQRHLRLMGVLYLVFIPVLILSLNQLHTVGKVSIRELQSIAVFFAAALGLSMTFVALLYFKRARPQESRIRSLLRELGHEG
jgi:hypothetical protein